jgi:hypothetical protein
MANQRDVLRKHAEELLSKPGVYAVGLGEKVSKGKRTGKKALICSIKQKKPMAQLTQEELIPQDVDGVPTDIVEIGDRPRAFVEYRKKQRPVVPGISTGHWQITAGTIGAVVEVDGDIMLLSNNHVFANENIANLGDPIIQPGDYDGGSVATDKIGDLYNYVPITFADQSEPTPPPTEPPPPPEPDPEPEPPAPDPEPDPPAPPEEDEDSDCPVANIFAKVANKIAEAFGRETRLRAVRPKKQTQEAAQQELVIPQIITNRVDGALATIDSDIDYSINYLTYITGVKGVNELAGVGTSVHKLGRTTGYTQGKILQTDVIVDVQYDGGIARFEDQLWIETGVDGSSFSAGGDSGSLIMDMDDNAVGLLFAGNDVVTFANPIDAVMQELNITQFIGN